MDAIRRNPLRENYTIITDPTTDHIIMDPTIVDVIIVTILATILVTTLVITLVIIIVKEDCVAITN